MPLTLMRRQMLVERLLVDVLGLEWATVHDEAERVAGAVSARVEERICELLNDPGTCPHGNPIPGSSHAPDQSAAIPLLEAQGLVMVTRVDDAIEGDHAAMRQLQACGLLPGRLAEVVGHHQGGVDVVGPLAHATIGATTAANTYVAPAKP